MSTNTPKLGLVNPEKGKGEKYNLALWTENNNKIDQFAEEASAQLADKANKVNVINEIANGDFSTQTVWAYSGAVGTIVNNESVFTANAVYGSCRQLLANASIANHVYYVTGWLKASSTSVQLQLYKNVGGSALGLKAHSGSGLYEKISFLAVATGNDVLGFRAIDYRSSAWTEVSLKEVAVYDLTEAYGVSPSLLDFEKDMFDKNASVFVVDKIVLDIISGKSALPNNRNKPIYVDLSLEDLNIIFKYNSTEDMRVNLKKTGVNNIFNFHQIYKIINDGINVSSDKLAGNNMLAGGTDWFGPWVIWADANANGDSISSYSFTGGNHNFNSLPTGRTSKLAFHVNGRAVTSFSDYADFIDIYWSNRIQASNTMKNDGTGREVMQENYHIHFDGSKFEVDCEIEWLENCHVFTYYGMQFVTTPWNGFVYYHSSANKLKNAGTAVTASGTKLTDKVTAWKNTDYIDMEIDINRGLGKREYNGTVDGAFVSGAKAYLKLITNADPDINQIYSYKGSYKFYSR